jgi:hypothetical protein
MATLNLTTATVSEAPQRKFQQSTKEKLNAQNEVTNELWQSLLRGALLVLPRHIYVTHLSYPSAECEANGERFQKLEDAILDVDT